MDSETNMIPIILLQNIRRDQNCCKYFLETVSLKSHLFKNLTKYLNRFTFEFYSDL